MDANILCTLLAQRLGAEPKKFEVHGQEVVFYDHALGRTKPSDALNESPYATPENRAIVADVIKNYDKLVIEYIDVAKSETENENLIQAKMRSIAIAELKAEGKL